MGKNEQIPAIRFQGFTDEWEQCKVGDYLTLSRILGHTGVDAKKLTVKLWAKGVVEKTDIYGGSENTQYYVRHTGQFMYGKLDFLHAAFGIVPESLNGYESTLDSPAFDLNGIDGSFLLNRVSQDDFYLKYGTIANGSRKAKRIHEDTFLAMPIAVPTIEEQKTIGHYFDNLDNLITLHQRKHEKLTNIKKSMLEKMFPRDGANVPEIRFSGFTDAWEQRKLGDVVKEITRNDPESEAPIMMITANNGFIEQSERYAFNNAGESLKKYILLKKGELAYNHGASKLRPYGSCFALTTAENARIPFVYHCFSAENQNAEFMSIELNGDEIENQLRKIVSSGARMDGLLNISFDEYTSVSVLLPGTEEQDRIADFFRHLDNLITLHQHKLEKLKNIKKSMLEKMFV